MDSYDDPLPGITYVSPRLDAFGQPGRKMRIASKLIEPPEAYAFGTLKGECLIRRTRVPESTSRQNSSRTTVNSPS